MDPCPLKILDARLGADLLFPFTPFYRGSMETPFIPFIFRFHTALLLLPGSAILCTATEEKVNYGARLVLQIPVIYQVRGHEQALQWWEKVINKLLLQANDSACKFKGYRFFKNILFLNKKTNFFYFSFQNLDIETIPNDRLAVDWRLSLSGGIFLKIWP